MDSVLNDNNPVRALAGSWLLLAVLALALSTACAVLLVVARAPLPEVFATSLTWFRSALVLHVSLAVVAWFLCCAAGLWTLAAGAVAGRWRWLALALAAAGIVGMVTALFFGTATPVLANYVPVLDSPVFLAGLVLFFCGIALCGLTACGALIDRLRAGQVELWRIGAALSIAAATTAAAAFIASLVTMGFPADAAGFDVLAWGPGHVLQFVHVLLLMSVWILLGQRALADTLAARRWLLALLLLAALPLLAVPIIYLQYPVNSVDFRYAFTALMRWGSWPAAALLAARLLWQFSRAGRGIWKAQLPLLLSVLLFLLGCGFGAMIRGESTMVPAHYHGTVGAVTLAYMALGYRLLPTFGFAINKGRLVCWQPVLYGVGLIVLASALAWSGWLGVPRKTMNVDVIVQYPAYFTAMGLVGLGGFLAVSGAGLFVVNIIRSLKNGFSVKAFGSTSRAVRIWAWVLTFGLTATIGLGLANGSKQTGALVSQQEQAHMTQKRKEEIDRRFAQAVALLNNQQYEAAANELHRVLELAPQMPEAHVNMGFAMIGVQRYALARDFFTAAIDLNKNQHNAYFGLAEALEGLNDLPGALGAMRSYVHLSKADDAFLRKANSAIWEWEERLKTAPGTTDAATASPIPPAKKSMESGH